MSSTASRILILDFGSQYTQLIARRVREMKVYCEIQPYNYPIEKIREFVPQGIILSGSPASSLTANAPTLPDGFFQAMQKGIGGKAIPVLGICYGMQITAAELGGRVAKAQRREYGPAEIKVLDAEDLFYDLKGDLKVWMSHGDKIDAAPKGFVRLAETDSAPFAAFCSPDRQFFGVQFHPEVNHTPQGREILENFLFRICKVQPDWSMASFVQEAIEEIRKRVGKERVILGLSGGVDSSVAAVLIHKAIGDQLTCIFVDNGLLRHQEADKIRTMFGKHFKIPLDCVDASELFLQRLKGVTDPERKRKIIGEAFIEVFEEEAKRIKGVTFLGQGTLYPDVIESISVHGPSVVIKSHHNVGGLPEKMGLKLLEPFRYLFKDEVRIIGTELGIPEEVVWRQPFPGPGLAVRILGEITPHGLDVLRQADVIVVDEIRKAGLYREIWQAFAVLLPISSVGVMGDERTYEQTIAVRAVHSVDGMTADWVRLPYDVLAQISSRIINEVKGINRVVYDISSKPPATIEWV